MKTWIMMIGLLVASGCGSIGPSKSPVSTPLDQISPVATPSPAAAHSPPASPQAGPHSAIERAIADLAERLQIDPESIQIEAVQGDEFPAQGLGCAKPTSGGLSGDKPAMVTGVSIQLRAGQVRYEYRSHGNELVFCGRRAN